MMIVSPLRIGLFPLQTAFLCLINGGDLTIYKPFIYGHGWIRGPKITRSLGDLLPLTITMGGYEPRGTVRDPGAAAFHGAMRVEVQLLEDGVVPVGIPKSEVKVELGGGTPRWEGGFFGR